MIELYKIMHNVAMAVYKIMHGGKKMDEDNIFLLLSHYILQLP